MARKKLTEQEKRRKELVRELLKEKPIRDGQDLNNIIFHGHGRYALSKAYAR